MPATTSVWHLHTSLPDRLDKTSGREISWQKLPQAGIMCHQRWWQSARNAMGHPTPEHATNVSAFACAALFCIKLGQPAVRLHLLSQGPTIIIHLHSLLRCNTDDFSLLCCEVLCKHTAIDLLAVLVLSDISIYLNVSSKGRRIGYLKFMFEIKKQECGNSVITS